MPYPMCSSMTKFCVLGNVESIETHFPGDFEVLSIKHQLIVCLGNAHILVHRLRFTAEPTQDGRD